MLTLTGLDEVKAYEGKELGVSDWHLVTQEKIDQFAEVTGDDQWIHVDPSRAAASPFGSTVAHGFLTLSLIPALTHVFAKSDPALSNPDVTFLFLLASLRPGVIGLTISC